MKDAYIEICKEIDRTEKEIVNNNHKLNQTIKLKHRKESVELMHKADKLRSYQRGLNHGKDMLEVFCYEELELKSIHN